jgi:hypothetical protein
LTNQDLRLLGFFHIEQTGYQGWILTNPGTDRLQLKGFCPFGHRIPARNDGIAGSKINGVTHPSLCGHRGTINHPINQAIVLSFLRRHKEIPIGVLLDPFQGLSGAIGHNSIQLLPDS